MAPYLLFLGRTLVCSTLVRDIPQDKRLTASVRLFGTIKFCAPELDSLHQALQQDTLDPLVELGYPLFEIRVALEVEAVNLTGV